MGLSSKRIVIWCGGAANQKALANKIASRFTVAGIVIDTHSAPAGKKKQAGLVSRIWDRLRFRKIYAAWTGLMKYYEEQFPAWPDVPRIEVPSVNDPATKKFTIENGADLVIVSGTALIKEPLISIPLSMGIINLHTGLSPYVKGGPNCTNWCIANGRFDLAGNTIMWLNAGIDTGNIITTETIAVQDAETLDEAHRRVMDHAHDLYLRAVNYLLNTEPPYTSVPQQTIDKGALYLTKMWTPDRKKQLLKNWKNRKAFKSAGKPVTVPLPDHNNS